MLNFRRKEIVLDVALENTAQSMGIKARGFILIALGQGLSAFQNERKGLHDSCSMPLELVEGVVSSSGWETRYSSSMFSRRAWAR